MYRRMLFSVAAVLLICPLAFGIGVIDILQDFDLGATNIVQRIGPGSSVEGKTEATVGHTQTDTDAMGGVVWNTQGAGLKMKAEASGTGGENTIRQEAGTSGDQEAHLGSPHAVGQSAAVLLGSENRKELGASSGEQKQEYEHGQNQGVTTAQGTTYEEQGVSAETKSKVSGAACSSAGAVQGLALVAGQVNDNDPCPCPGPGGGLTIPGLDDLLGP